MMAPSNLGSKPKATTLQTDDSRLRGNPQKAKRVGRQAHPFVERHNGLSHQLSASSVNQVSRFVNQIVRSRTIGRKPNKKSVWDDLG